MFLSDTCSNLKLPAVSVHIQKALVEMCQVAQGKIIYKDQEGTLDALDLVAWFIHKWVCFWVTLGYFPANLFQFTLVFGITLSIHLHR